MYSVMLNSPECGCKARVVVSSHQVCSYFMYSCDEYHNHFVNKAEITAEELKQRMAEIVQMNPVEPEPVGEIKRQLG